MGIFTYIYFVFCTYRFRRESTGMLLRFQEENDTLQLQQAGTSSAPPAPVPATHQQAPRTPVSTVTHQRQQQPQPTYPSYSPGGWNEALNEGNLWHYQSQRQSQSHYSRLTQLVATSTQEYARSSEYAGSPPVAIWTFPMVLATNHL